VVCLAAGEIACDRASIHRGANAATGRDTLNAQVACNLFQTSIQGENMKRLIITGVVGVAAALFQTVSYAGADAQAEAKEHGCLNCHAVDKKKVGPAYQEVSAKYKGKKPGDVAAAMKALPVHQSVLKKTKDDDLNHIMEWILTL
jgi:cytochrome c